VDISDPDTTFAVDFCYHPGYGVNVALYDHYAYVAADQGGGGFYVIDIADPENMCVVDTVWLWISYGVTTEGGYGYIVTNDYLRVLDLSDPAHPAQIASCIPGAFCRNLTVRDGLAYVVGGGLEVFDVSNPYVPVSLGCADLPGISRDIVLWEDYAFIAADAAGVRVFDISDPNAMTEVAFYNTPGKAWGLVVDTTIIYLADSSHFGVYEFLNDFPVIALRPDTLDYGEVPLDSVECREFWVVNSGTDTLVIDSILSDHDAFVWINDPLYIVMPGESLIVAVCYAPPDTLAHEGRITVYSNAGDPWVTCLGRGVLITGTPRPTPLPAEYAFLPAYPNPFNASTNLRFTLPHSARVEMIAYDLLGREAAVIADGQFLAGSHEVSWQCGGCASGVYVVVMRTEAFRASQKRLLMR
jgi:hypothetical protein